MAITINRVIKYLKVLERCFFIASRNDSNRLVQIVGEALSRMRDCR